MNRPSPDAIARAHEHIDPVFLRTPLLRATSLDDVLGVQLALKVETLNPIRSFKGRGTDLYVSQNLDASRLVCASAGNFGQGLAWAGRGRGIGVVVFAAETANPLKVEAMRRLGADVRLAGRDFDEAKDRARAFAAEQELPFVEDGAESAIAEGAGTIAAEITEAGLELDAILVPLGNGALATGIGCWMKHAAPAVQVIGVVAAGAPSMLLSFEAGEPRPTSAAATIADGIAVREPVPYAVACMPGLIDSVVAVDEEAIRRAMRLAHQHLGLVVEPAGAVGLAALLSGGGRRFGGRVATILCGGNVTAEQAREWLA